MSNDPTQCRGSKAGDGCNGEFLNKTNPGLCLKCQSLVDAAADEQEQTRIEEIPQCFGCGGFGKNVKDNKCTRCQRKETEEAAQMIATQTKKAALNLRSSGH
ncbi:hypothetical protein FB451DRAFT_1237762 [Mycena latifolia]|nr:hypothetical protein FB451DRAFT_1237762 [Mycena latifolia]